MKQNLLSPGWKRSRAFDFGRGDMFFHKGHWCQRWHLYFGDFHRVWHIPTRRET